MSALWLGAILNRDVTDKKLRSAKSVALFRSIWTVERTHMYCMELGPEVLPCPPSPGEVSYMSVSDHHSAVNIDFEVVSFTQ